MDAKQYRLFKAYVNSKRLDGHETFNSSRDLQRVDEGERPGSYYASSNNLNNFAIQNLDESGTGDAEIDPVFERTNRLMSHLGKF